MATPRKLMIAVCRSSAVLALAFGCVASGDAHPAGQTDTSTGVVANPDHCSVMAGMAVAQAGQIIQAAVGPHNFPSSYPGRPPSVLPTHCEVTGVLEERIGRLGEHYAIHYHLRLPEAWNGRLLFQGGSGTDGNLGDAIGDTGGSAPSALARGFAVVSQDSGHDNATNTDPKWGGQTVFGTDPLARRNYGHASLPLVARAAKAVVARYYGKQANHSYFFGCSKGGQEGMAAAQRYPDLFDGIIAGAPGFALPRAALNEVWSVKHFAELAREQSGRAATVAAIAKSFTPAQFTLVRNAVLEACDAADGLVDGITADFRSCTSKKVMRALHGKACTAAHTTNCLSDQQIRTLVQVMDGPTDHMGRPMYATWAWDAGIGSPLWALWRIGNAQMPAFDIALGGAAMASVFSTPPIPVAPTAEALLTFQQNLNLPQAERSIYATNADFPQSAWQEIGMHSSDLSGFFARGGKLMVPHGAADPVFSLLDTLEWWNRVRARFGKQAEDHLKVYPVPGMAHCFGGPAVSDYDLLQPMVEWVEQAKAPAIIASATDQTPWPGRTRPLCAWPRIARYRGGDQDNAESFICAQ